MCVILMLFTHRSCTPAHPQPKTASGGGISREEVLENAAQNILNNVPQPVNLSDVMEKYPVLYEQSMNTVLVQEVIRYNKLLSVVHQSLKDLQKALKGLVVMSQQLEDMSNSLFINTVPAMWAGKAYPSLKPLASWVTDLMSRMEFIQHWIDVGIPTVSGTGAVALSEMCTLDDLA